MKNIITVIGCCFFININAQTIVVGFYNCENFYDTTNQANVIDEDFLPNSIKAYNTEAYSLKAKHISSVLYKIGLIDNTNGISLFGLAEIENKIVLNNLLENPLIKKYHYKYIHFDSKDPRGVDVALIYNPANFTPYQFKPISLTDSTHFITYATRDILFVKGQLNHVWVNVLVNHWPSRRGGESSSKRIWAASVCKKFMDSVQVLDPTAKFIVMGDFNDNPNNKSLELLKLNNPFSDLFKNGIGSIAFKDSWNLFDQILLSPNWRIPNNPIAKTDSMAFSTSYNNLTHYKPIIYSTPDMIETQGKYQGYPKRTYDGDRFRGGYSDHFPVALIFKPNLSGNTLK